MCIFIQLIIYQPRIKVKLGTMLVVNLKWSKTDQWHSLVYALGKIPLYILVWFIIFRRAHHSLKVIYIYLLIFHKLKLKHSKLKRLKKFRRVCRVQRLDVDWVNDWVTNEYSIKFAPLGFFITSWNWRKHIHSCCRVYNLAQKSE